MASSDARLQSPCTACLTDMPVELLQHVLAMLPAAERATVALTCRGIAAAVAGSEAATSSGTTNSCWRTVALPQLSPSGDSLASLLTWAARRSSDIQRLRLSAPILVQGDGRVDVTHTVLGLLHAVRTLRIDDLCDDGDAAVMCAIMLTSMAWRPKTARLTHLALHDLSLQPDNPQLVAAIQAQTHLVELVLSFSPSTVAASASAAATVLTAAGACAKLQQLCVTGTNGLGLRCIPSSVAALESLVSLDLRGCSLAGTLQLPPALINLRLDDCTAHKLPASLGAMTALTRLEATSAAAPPPAWPPRVQVLKINGRQWDADANGLLGSRLASLAAVTTLRHLHLKSCSTLSACVQELDTATVKLPALEGLGLVHCNLLTVPLLECLGRLKSLDLSCNRFSEVPRMLLAATACESLDLCNSFKQPGSLGVSSLVVFFNLTTLKRLNLKAVLRWLADDPPRKQQQRQLLAAVAEMMSVRRPPATVAIHSDDPFPEAVPGVRPLLATNCGWREYKEVPLGSTHRELVERG